ncbi:hypothetical protein T439DRAFT_359286 [Meredithblackwellia eburnea MCA 4105]
MSSKDVETWTRCNCLTLISSSLLLAIVALSFAIGADAKWWIGNGKLNKKDCTWVLDWEGSVGASKGIVEVLVINDEHPDKYHRYKNIGIKSKTGTKRPRVRDIYNRMLATGAKQVYWKIGNNNNDPKKWAAKSGGIWFDALEQNILSKCY